LREDKHSQDVRVDAVRNCDVHEAIFSAKRHGRLGALLGKRKEASSCASA